MHNKEEKASLANWAAHSKGLVGLFALSALLCSLTSDPRPQQVSQPAAARAASRNKSALLDEDEYSAARKVVATQRPLPRMTSSFNPNDQFLLEAATRVFYGTGPANLSIATHGQDILVTKGQSMVYSDIYIHNYDQLRDLQSAAGPEVDQELCLSQLSNLVRRSERLKRLKYRSDDINLYRLLDTFGHFSSGVLLGNLLFEGMYHECLRLEIREHPEGEPVGTRYCLAKLSHADWNQVDLYDVNKLKMGVCLPRSCDSLDYKSKFSLVKQLLASQTRPMDQGEFLLESLYCLPDELSPMRSIVSSPKACATLVALCAWIALVLHATRRHSQLVGAGAKWNEKLVRRSSSSFGLTTGLSGSRVGPNSANEQQLETSHSRLEQFYSLLSITNNLKSLLNTSKQSSLLESNSREASGARPAVDLSCIEGIKVIAMCYIIMGHVLMCVSILLSNARELASASSLAFYLAYLVPAFAVNCFFTITGLLTAYLIFKQNTGSPSSLVAPNRWAALVAYRYLRIMPLYALVVLYSKTLAKFTGAGPLWDYGTSSLSQRRTCELEPWSRTLLFGANFAPPLEHCIPAGWYLANDFQFALVAPPLLALVHKWPRLGKRLLVALILAGSCAGFWSIFSRHELDVRPIARFAPNGFKTYTSQFSSNYTQPQYRIPAFLIGLLVGLRLFEYEQSKDDDNKKKDGGDEKQRLNGCNNEIEVRHRAGWSEMFKKNGIWLASALVVFCCLTPPIAALLTFERSTARLLVALVIPSYHVFLATATACYVMLATTGHVNKTLASILSAPAWKPLSRLSLSALLVNVEVINYFVQSSSSTHHTSNLYLVALNMFCIVATYAVATVVCVLFEAPIRGALNALLAHLMAKQSVSGGKSAMERKSANCGQESAERAAVPKRKQSGQL